MLNKNKTNNIDRDSVLHQYQCSFVAPVSSIETKASSDYYKTSSTNITGNEAKEFYENLVKDKSNDKNSKTTCDTTKCHVKVKEEEEYNFGGNLIPADDTIVRQLVNNLLRASSSGNKNSVVRCIKNIKGYTDFNAILNGQDEFGWNALMCAAAEGHLHIVKYLLKEGCEYKNVTDNSGMDLFELCELKNQFGIYVYLLDNENKYNNCKTNSFNGSIKSSCQTSTSVDCSRNRKKTKMINKDSGETLLKCELCDSSFHQNERIQHESSVMHIFNDNKNVVKNIYGIPDTNIGFQMMLRSGWNSNAGLGPDGCGRRNPVKPVIKQNRHGLGEVVEAQKYQSTQLNSKQELLTRLQFELEQALKVYDEAELDLKSLNRKLYLMQDSSLTLKKNCSELQTDIVSILKEKQCLHNKLLESKWSQCRSVKEFQIYTEKMESFKKNMDLYFENNEIHKQIKILHSQILENKQTVKVLSNEEQFLSKDEVTEAVRLKDEVTEAVRDLKEQEKDVEHSQKNMCNLKEQTILLRKEVDAINKRNAAQLSRLKHHLEEKKNRCSALKVEIASLERKLKELEKS